MQPPTISNWPRAGDSAGGSAQAPLNPGDAGCERCCALYTRGRHERLSVQPRDAAIVQARCGADGAGCSAEALPEAWQIDECGWATLALVRCGEECMRSGGAFWRVLSQQDLERRSPGSEAKAAGFSAQEGRQSGYSEACWTEEAAVAAEAAEVAAAAAAAATVAAAEVAATAPQVPLQS